jgi:8-oxo-dGTP diphosphatase
VNAQREPAGAAIDVAASVVRDGSGRVLLAERTARQVSAGFWELPGGKVDGAETAAQAAARELHEEIGIEAEALAPWVVYEHAFPTKRVRLHFFRADRWRGQPHGREGQRLAWVDPAAPAVGPLLPSNARALTLLGLPPLLAITRVTDGAGTQAFVERELPALLAADVRLLQVREARLSGAQQVHFARRIAERARTHGARVMLAATALECRRAGAAGQHCTAAQLRALPARPPLALWSASCHNLDDVRCAEGLGADFVIVSPVRATTAHSGAAALGWANFARIAAATPLPVYAQGGLGPADLAQARQHGAVGIAVNAGALLATRAEAAAVHTP